MRDYAELIKALRHCNEIGGGGCFSCLYFARCEQVRKDIHCKIHCAVQADAADAIEELLEEKRLLESNVNLQAKIIQHMKTVMKANGLRISGGDRYAK